MHTKPIDPLKASTTTSIQNKNLKHLHHPKALLLFNQMLTKAFYFFLIALGT